MYVRFSIKDIYICPFEKIDDEILKPNLNYPTRYCVIDNDNKIAIDIKTKLKYDYVETTNNKHFLKDSYKKIQENKRVAIFPLTGLGYDKDNLMSEVGDIVRKLKNNKDFKDGNEVYNNEQYIEYLKQEQANEQQITQKNKKKKVLKRKK